MLQIPIDPTYRSLFELPNLSEPIVLDGSESSCLALIPVFSDAYIRTINTEAFIRAAIHSRRTCLENTDAIAENVSVKLYIEEELVEILSSVLESNHINLDKDIISFKAPPLEHSENGSWGHLGKQMIPYWDDRFKNYKWILVWDADVFWRSVPEQDFFSRVKKYPAKEIGYIDKSQTFKLRKLLEREIKQSGMSVEELFDFAGIPQTLLETDILDKSVGHFWMYPAQHFHENHQDFIDWMWEYAPYIGNDEICAGIWSHLFDLNFYSISKELGLQTGKMYDVLHNAKECDIFHGRPTPYNEENKGKFHKLLGIES